MSRQLDVLFVESFPGKKVYQDLVDKWTAIETPTWSLLLAQSCRAKGFGVDILDCNTKRLQDDEAIKLIKEKNPRLVVFVTYGSNPNSGTYFFSSTLSLAKRLKEVYPEFLTCSVGSYTSALPKEVLEYGCFDIVLLNEGVYALHNLLKTDLKFDSYMNVKGIGFNLGFEEVERKGVFPWLNEPEKIVPQELMDYDLPGYAWDLIDPRDYRSHVWSADFNEEYRNPYAALYTSLGCRYSCSFCMINILNRTNNDDNITSKDSAIMRYWSPDFIIKEFDKLAVLGVTTIRISDEMFYLNKKYYEPLLTMLKDRDYNIRSWSYSRSDSVNPRFLDLFRSAGINYLAIGFEAANLEIRKKMTKGTYKDTNLKALIDSINNAGINVIGNYIVGNVGENLESMNETKQLAFDLNTEMMNVYPSMPIPGSPLHLEAKENGIKLPDTLDAYSFHSYNCQPMPTEYLTAAEIIKFRDEMWLEYMTSNKYLNKVRKKFGEVGLNTIREMSKIKLRRKLLED